MFVKPPTSRPYLLKNARKDVSALEGLDHISAMRITHLYRDHCPQHCKKCRINSEYQSKSVPRRLKNVSKPIGNSSLVHSSGKTLYKYVKHKKLLLKTHPDFNEKWVQERIAEDPSITFFNWNGEPKLYRQMLKPQFPGIRTVPLFMTQLPAYLTRHRRNRGIIPVPIVATYMYCLARLALMRGQLHLTSKVGTRPAVLKSKLKAHGNCRFSPWKSFAK